MPSKPFHRVGRSSSLLLALLIGLVNGIIFIALMPPWQHYDEPNHFEYAWLMAKRGGVPAQGDYSRSMRQEVAASMLRNNFYRGMNYMPDLNPDSGPIWIGPISQLNNPPLYYAVAALPLSLLRNYRVEIQLMAGRLVSLLFYLITIAAAWGVMAEITPDGHPLRLLVPVTIAFLPGFADSMTAMNNDAAAVALTSVCLWGSVRMVKQGINLLNALWVFGTAVLSVLAKETAFMALPLVAVAALLVIFPQRKRWIAWAILGVGIVSVGALLFTWGDSTGWYRSTSQKIFTRVESSKAVDGRYAFQLDTRAADTPPWIPSLFQPVLVSQPEANAETTYTLGAWMWADRPTRAVMPILGDGINIHKKEVEVGLEPSFHSITVTVHRDNGVRLWVSLDPAPKESGETIYYDGLVLIEGTGPVDGKPKPAAGGGTKVTWGGAEYTNLLHNASAEQAGLRVRPLIDDLGSRFLPDHTRPSALLTYAVDWRGAGWQYALSLDRLHKTFWGQFGWGHVSLAGNKPYRYFAFLTLLGVAGAAIWLVRRLIWRRELPWDQIALMGILMVGTWLGTVSRGAIYLGINRLYLPVARYALPAIIPTIAFLCLGWLELLKLPAGRERWDKIYPKYALPAWFAILAAIDLYAIASIYFYYAK